MTEDVLPTVETDAPITPPFWERAPVTQAEWIKMQRENARFREALRSIAESDPVVIDGKEWRMERQDAIKRARAGLEGTP